MYTGLISFRIAKYLKHIFVSVNRKGHGIHSPFVFNLVNRVLRNRPETAIVCSIENVRKRLLRDNRVIDFKDFGAGLGSQGNNPRKVSYIARYSPVPEKYGILLANMAAEFGGQLIVEFGTSLGISTLYLASFCGGTPVISTEGSPAVAEIADNNFKAAGLKNIRLNVGSFDDWIPVLINQGIKPGLIFIDGNHRKEPLLEYFKRMAEISGNNTVIIIDDINYSPEMGEAWNEIKRYGKVTLTIDLFRMGIVFFRKGIGCNNYIIRY